MYSPPQGISGGPSIAYLETIFEQLAHKDKPGGYAGLTDEGLLNLDEIPPIDIENTGGLLQLIALEKL